MSFDIQFQILLSLEHRLSSLQKGDLASLKALDRGKTHDLPATQEPPISQRLESVVADSLKWGPTVNSFLLPPTTS